MGCAATGPRGGRRPALHGVEDCREGHEVLDDLPLLAVRGPGDRRGVIARIAKGEIAAKLDQELDHLELSSMAALCSTAGDEAGVRDHPVDVDAELCDQAHAVAPVRFDGSVDHVDPAVESELLEKRGILGEPGPRFLAPAGNARERERLYRIEIDLLRAVLQQVPAIASLPARRASSYGVRPVRRPAVLTSTPRPTSSFTRSGRLFRCAPQLFDEQSRRSRASDRPGV